MHVIATAGHVDHGKSTLVKALTGADPDRLGEEHRRGMSIELGYCWTSLPEVGSTAFVDVPGHERFISTMLAGVGPVPAVLFVVAADDPWMPQAAEHLAALQALAVSSAVVAVTRSDLADPGPAAARALAELKAASFGEVTAVPVSGRTGAGLDELRSALAAMLLSLPEPDLDDDIRLWVDRRFHIKGAGTVVTGTLSAGRIRVGDRLTVNHDEVQVRVRGIQSLGSNVGEVAATARVALSLGGGTPDGLDRGSALLTPGAWLATSTADVHVDAAQDLPTRPLLHIGATAVGVHSRPLGDAFTRLTLERPLPLRVGDRVLLRDPGTRSVWGAVVVDPAPPPLRRRGAARERAEILSSAGSPPRMGDIVRRHGVVRLSRLRKLGYRDAVSPPVVAAGDWLLDPTFLARLRERLRDRVRQHDAEYPLDPGLALAIAARELGLPTADLIAPLVASPLTVENGRVVQGSSPLPAPLAHSLDVLAADLAENPYAAPGADRLRELGLDSKSVAAATRAGRLLRLEDGVVLLPGADRNAIAELALLPQPFTVSEARVRLGSSRRVVLPLLAHLDRAGLTQRLPDDRRLVVQVPART